MITEDTFNLDEAERYLKMYFDAKEAEELKNLACSKCPKHRQDLKDLKLSRDTEVVDLTHRLRVLELKRKIRDLELELEER